MHNLVIVAILNALLAEHCARHDLQIALHRHLPAVQSQALDPWIDEAGFRPSKHRFITHQQARAIDSAISSVSSTRGNLGAIQNRFESTINNLQVATENLAASESRIRDTDMALEMTKFTRHQVLLQAGTAMLGQANQLPQSVLRLLQ